MQPFDQYPGDGHTLLPQRKAANTRREDGPELQRLTGQTACAYCSVCLTDNYHHWLLMTIDHVIPTSECERLGIPEDWSESYSNMVLACSGCNPPRLRGLLQGLAGPLAAEDTRKSSFTYPENQEKHRNGVLSLWNAV